jgi:cytoskeleton protein RodZ
VKKQDDSPAAGDSPEPGGPLSPGARLRQAREARRLPIESAAQQLRVPVAVLKSIEDDCVDGLAPIYQRGYVRAYARIVGLTEEGLLESLPMTETRVVVTSHSGRAMRQGVRPGAGLKLATLAVVAVLAGLMVASFRTPVVDDAGVDAELDARLDAGLDPELAAPTPEPPTLPEAPDAPDMATSAGVPQPGPPPPETPAAAPPGPMTPSEAALVAGLEPALPAPAVLTDAELAAGHNLVLELDRDSWTEVQDARGAKLYYALAAAGQIIKVAGQPPFRVVLGNAPDVEVYYNGKPFDITPWSHGRVARFTVGDNAGGRR